MLKLNIGRSTINISVFNVNKYAGKKGKLLKYVTKTSGKNTEVITEYLLLLFLI